MKVESRHLPSKAICLTKSQVFLVFEMEAGWKSSGNSTQVVNYDPYISVWKRHDNDWRWEWDIWQLDGHDPSTYLTPGCITIMSDCWLVKFTSILNFTSRLLLRQILSKKRPPIQFEYIGHGWLHNALKISRFVSDLLMIHSQLVYFQDQIVNHYCKASSFTTKVSATKIIRFCG